MDNFKLITFIEGIESVWQSGPRKVEYGWHENHVPQWIVPVVGRWFVTTMGRGAGRDGAR